MERFILTPKADLTWTVCDNETAVSIDFRDGLYNDTLDAHIPESVSDRNPEDVPTIMREIGDWLAQQHCDIAMCQPRQRAEALWTLAREEYWVTMADATSSLVIDFGREHAADYLYDEVRDYLADVPGGSFAVVANAANLLGSISLLSDGAAWEALMMIRTYWRYKADSVDIRDWARDLLWWPAWCPKGLLINDQQDNEEE